MANHANITTSENKPSQGIHSFLAKANSQGIDVKVAIAFDVRNIFENSDNNAKNNDESR